MCFQNANENELHGFGNLVLGFGKVFGNVFSGVCTNPILKMKGHRRQCGQLAGYRSHFRRVKLLDSPPPQKKDVEFTSLLTTG